ncbi:hypothetical protein CANCADRAFT_103872 [Tortispora caseinolytica NRRL Y-17796]|uniref:Uncharacterized protein n=1 Tax=Tortispora caseinolytica NRRL Y-17796 TaxID=767744 RepID=A0A1E4TEP5_9ASCO|nr:hypothetical protein CANCADRAFT_103872 [Tortispora caseinolytica NRRL Y-17796]
MGFAQKKSPQSSDAKLLSDPPTSQTSPSSSGVVPADRSPSRHFYVKSHMDKVNKSSPQPDDLLHALHSLQSVCTFIQSTLDGISKEFEGLVYRSKDNGSSLIVLTQKLSDIGSSVQDSIEGFGKQVELNIECTSKVASEAAATYSAINEIAQSVRGPMAEIPALSQSIQNTETQLAAQQSLLQKVSSLAEYFADIQAQLTDMKSQLPKFSDQLASLPSKSDSDRIISAQLLPIISSIQSLSEEVSKANELSSNELALIRQEREATADEISTMIQQNASDLSNVFAASTKTIESNITQKLDNLSINDPLPNQKLLEQLLEKFNTLETKVDSIPQIAPADYQSQLDQYNEQIESLSGKKTALIADLQMLENAIQIRSEQYNALELRIQQLEERVKNALSGKAQSILSQQIEYAINYSPEPDPKYKARAATYRMRAVSAALSSSTKQERRYFSLRQISDNELKEKNEEHVKSSQSDPLGRKTSIGRRITSLFGGKENRSQ